MVYKNNLVRYAKNVKSNTNYFQMKRNNSIIESKGGRLSMKYGCMIEVEMKWNQKWDMQILWI
jgi:hypothetical protein